MSQLASFTELPIQAVHRLNPIALVKKRLFRKPVYLLDEYLKTNGADLGDFEAGDGLYFVLALLYLQQWCGINLLDSNKGAALLAQSLTKYHGSFFTFLTDEDRVHHEAVRTAKFEPAKLKRLCEQRGIEQERYSDLPTLQLAASKIADLLSQMKDDHVVLVSVG